ncbi:MAG: hypothetical protein JWR75_2098 [Devosia sp.]|nr:hypothetical protein [Devosia sp.]
MNEPHIRIRAERVDAALTREALKVVLPINRQLGPWQIKAARLLAHGTRLNRTGRNEPRLMAEAEQLAEHVEAQRRRLITELNALPPEFARHGRFQDTLKALNSISEGVRAARAMLEQCSGNAVAIGSLHSLKPSESPRV